MIENSSYSNKHQGSLVAMETNKTKKNEEW